VRTLHFVVPDGVDDPARPSGGNTYDGNLARELTVSGWSVHEHPVAGFWDEPDEASLAALEDAVRRIPDGGLALFDGLLASRAPDALAAHAGRLRPVVLVHMPLGLRPPAGNEGEVRLHERAALSSADAVVTTSAWSRERLIELYDLPPARLHVAEPGVQAAELATGTATGERLLTVAAVTSEKGHDVLLEALTTISDLSWRSICVGSTDRDPGFVEALRGRAREQGLDGRMVLKGTAAGAGLARAYADADLMVLPSRAETYGMVVTEALARGLPVVVAEVGGIEEALGTGADGSRPGLLVPAEDPEALAGALRSWLTDTELRERLRRLARERRRSLPGWPDTASAMARVLAGLEP
jgi:glycosyltransferase involved in cell wall biosynthesis